VISWGKAASGVDQPLPSSAEFKERVELHIYFPTVASWQDIRELYLFTVLSYELNEFLFTPRMGLKLNDLLLNLCVLGVKL